jgi:hypothetical protein
VNNFPNVRGRVKSMGLGGSETGLMQIRLSGPDTGVLAMQADFGFMVILALAGSIL